MITQLSFEGTSDPSLRGEFRERVRSFCPRSRLLVLFSLCIGVLVPGASPAISIQGRVTSGRVPIWNASVVFISENDTTVKYTAVTDRLGYYRIDITAGIGSPHENLPLSFHLGQNYPNPFSSFTTIPYLLARPSEAEIAIYDVRGREVRRFALGRRGPGLHILHWDGKDQHGRPVPSGVYFCQLVSEGHRTVKKMAVLRESNSASASREIPVTLFRIASESLSLQTSWGRMRFTARISNTDSTLPLIEPVELRELYVSGDTTINFSVPHIPTVTVDCDSVHQIVRGFGAATPWYLSPATDSDIEKAFGTGEGQIGLTILRLTVEPDSNMWMRWVPSARKAHEMGAIIIASPWYAPPELTEYRDGKLRIKRDKYAEYAAHLNRFVRFMERNGVPIYGLSVQNEPNIGDWTNWSPEEMLVFLRDYADAIEGTRVMAPEAYNFDRAYSDPILNDSAACANTDIICGHIYGVRPARYPLAEQEGKEVWMTEYLMGENNSGNNLYWAIQLAENITDVMQANMNTYIWWTMVRYYGMIGDGNTAANPQDPREKYPDRGEVTKKGYVMSQFAKFVRPGYYRVHTFTYPRWEEASVTAYKDLNSGKIVIVAVNSGSSEIHYAFRIEDEAMISSFRPYTTSRYRNCEPRDPVQPVKNVFVYTLEEMSVTTFVTE